MPHNGALSPEVIAALEQCRWMIEKGSKSFSLAAKIFGPETRHAAFFLYGWCRYCDDQVDQGSQSDVQAEREIRLEMLKHSTRSAFTQERQQDPVFIAFQHVTQKHSIPEHYPLELLEGMSMDVRGQQYATLDDLLLYCYRVAGTVGLMMSHIMGISDEKALKHASDLGIAMQLTNIARDIIEDAESGRIYLPLSWLEEAGIPPAKISQPLHREKLFRLTTRLLDEAERYYRSGDEGLRYLPLRSACAIAAARQVYAEIGTLLRRKGVASWDERTYVPTMRKLFVIAGGICQVLGSVPKRIRKPWSSVPITKVWRHPMPQT